MQDAGLDDVRPDVGTYGRYEFDRLLPLPFEMRGDFTWLAAEPMHDNSISDQKAAENAKSLERLKKSSARSGVPLPQAFTKFLEKLELPKRIRSNTDCFLDLCPEPVPSPVGGGYLVRFLADSQGCVFWYLYLTSDGSDHAVVSSPGFYGAKAESRQAEPPDPVEIVYVGESFESFMCRYWLENEIWFAKWKNTPISKAGREYIESYRGKRG